MDEMPDSESRGRMARGIGAAATIAIGVLVGIWLIASGARWSRSLFPSLVVAVVAAMAVWRRKPKVLLIALTVAALVYGIVLVAFLSNSGDMWGGGL